MSDGDSLSEDAHALSDEEMVVRPGSNGPELARQYILATSQPPRTVFEGFFGRAAASVVRGRPAPCSRSPQSQPTQPAVAADGGRSRSPQSQSKPEERSPAHPLDQGLGGPPGASPVLDDPSGEDLEGTWVNGAGYLSYCRCIPGVHHTLPIPGEELRRCFECLLPISPHGEPQGGERDEEDEASWVEWQRRLREEGAQAAWQQWVDWKTNGTGIFTLELALPHLLRGALLIQGGWNAPTSLDVVLRRLQDDAWANAEALQDDAWAVATAVAESGHVDYDDEASVFEWAAATAAAMRRVAHG